MERERSSARFVGLDGLRALAVGFVLLNHADPRISTGPTGVSMFFVLSGYLITSILMRDARSSDRIRLRLFYARRLLRLYPALLAMLIVTVALGAAPKTALVAATYTTNLVSSLLGKSMHAYGHTWSLAQEEQFYLIWPLILPIVLRRLRGSVVVLSGLATLSVLAAWFSTAASAHDADGALAILHGLNPAYQVHGMIIGCILALVGVSRFTASPTRLIYLGLGVLAAGLIILSLEQNREWMLGWDVVTPEIAAAILVVGLVTAGTARPAALFTNRVSVWAGQRSYAIYLWHYPLIVLGIDHGLSQHRSALIGIPTSFILAELSYRYVEAPFLRIKDRLMPPSERSPYEVRRSGPAHRRGRRVSDPAIFLGRVAGESSPQPDANSAPGWDAEQRRR